MNFYKRYPADYGRKTARLSLAEHGAYTLLLDELYMSEQALPADVEELYRVCRAMSKAEQVAVHFVAEKFFPVGEDGMRHNKRAMEELVEAAPAIQAARTNGRKGGRKKEPRRNPVGSGSDPPNENPVGFQNETQEPTQIEPSEKAPQSLEKREEKEKEKEPSVLVKRCAFDPYRVPDCPYDTLLALYHDALPSLPRVTIFSAGRKVAMRARWVEVCAAEKYDLKAGIEWFRDFFRGVGKSEFLAGKSSSNGSDRGWKANLDWLLTPRKFVKVIEGQYHRELA